MLLHKETPPGVIRRSQRSLSSIFRSTTQDKLGPDEWFSVTVEGNDLLFTGRATCFGGDDDPQDDGSTASGISTQGDPAFPIKGCALPMNGLQFTTSSQAFHEALDHSPIPRLPWLTPVVVTFLDSNRTYTYPAIDLGPAKDTGNVIDLTPAAARDHDPSASATTFAAQVQCRIPGGALWIPQTGSTR